VTVKARLVPGNYLLGWVLGHGGQAEVAGPPDVRELLRARVADLAAVYAG
jgi:proteasome accessory factor C